MMSHDEFEQQLSESLNDPKRDELREQIERLAAESTELQALRQRWLRLHELLRVEPAFLNRVNWSGLRARIGAILAREAQAEANETEQLMARLQSATELPTIVGRLPARLRFSRGAATGRAVPRPGPVRRFWRIAGLVTAAAAMIVLVLRRPVSSPTGSAMVAIVIPHAESAAGDAIARTTVREQTDEAAMAEQRQYELSRAARPAELFLMIAPAREGEREVSGIDRIVLN